MRFISAQNLRAKRTSGMGEDGAVTVEFVLWLPVFLLIVGLIIDSTLAMTLHSRHYDVARDAARAGAIGRLTEAQAEANAEDILGGSHDVEVVPSGDYMVATVSVPLSSIVIFYDSLMTGNLTAKVTMLRELDEGTSSAAGAAGS